MVEDNRVTARLGNWEPPKKYNQPVLEPDGGTRTAEHEVLAAVTVVQDLGDEAERFTLRGDGYESDISKLRDLKGDIHELRHTIHSGKVFVESVRARSTNSYDVIDGERKWVYNYTVDLLGSNGVL